MKMKITKLNGKVEIVKCKNYETLQNNLLVIYKDDDCREPIVTYNLNHIFKFTEPQ